MGPLSLMKLNLRLQKGCCAPVWWNRAPLGEGVGAETPANVTAANDCLLHWKLGGKLWELWEGKDVVSSPDNCSCSSLDPVLWWSLILN